LKSERADKGNGVRPRHPGAEAGEGARESMAKRDTEGSSSGAAVTRQEFAALQGTVGQLSDGVNKLLDALSPKVQQGQNGGGTVQAPLPQGQQGFPNVPATGQPQGLSLERLAALAPLLKDLDPGGGAGQSLAEQMLLMGWKDSLDTNALLKRVALERLTGGGQPGTGAH